MIFGRRRAARERAEALERETEALVAEYFHFTRPRVEEWAIRRERELRRRASIRAAAEGRM